MFTRPKANESEEDLLKFQEEFLASQINPAALAVNVAEAKRKHELPRDVVSLDEKPGTVAPPPVKKSKFQQQQQKEKAVQFEDDDPEERLEKHDQHITKILSEIVERDNRGVVIQQPRQCSGSRGFPSVFHLKGQSQSSTGPAKKKKSLFAQQLAKMSPKDLGVSSLPSVQKDDAEIMETDSPNIVSDSGQASGQSLDETAKRIHEENAAKLSQMTENEIVEEQKKLLEMLDPKMIEFLKSRKKGPPASSTERDVSTKSVKKPDDEIISKESPKVPLADLPVKSKKNWMNMNKIEYDKLEWMKELPKPSADSEKGHQARFDFEGQVVAANADLPTHLGLHHHGDEPERAGYTLEEIFTLCRSTVLQQRVLALQILTKILRNAKAGAFIQCLMKPLILTLLDSGLVFLLRWALDDSLDPVQHAAVHAMHALVFDSNDQAGLDSVFSWHCGHETAMFSPMVEEDISEFEEEKIPKSDADIVKEDLIKGLYRMSLLERLRYILEVCKPPADVVVDALEIISRIVQHSPEAAYQVYQCPRLLDVITKEFLPNMWEPVDSPQITQAYGHPLSTAMKLMRSVCQSGRHMAAFLVAKYGLMECITRYIAVQPKDLGLPLQEAYKLSTECFRTWSVCMDYGLGTDRFNELYPLLMKTLMQVHMNTLQADCDPLEVSRAVALIGFLESTMLTAASGTQLSQSIASHPDRENPAPPAVKWNDIMGMLQPIEICANKHMQQFIEEYEKKRHQQDVLSACLHFMASYYSKCQQQPGYNAVECCTYMELMSNSLLLPLMKSTPFRMVMTALRKHSNYLSEETTLKETPPSLPGVGSTVQPVDPDLIAAGSRCQCPVISEGSPVNFLTAVMRVIYHTGQLHRGITEQLYSQILQHDGVVQYLRRICKAGPSNLAFNYFTKFENRLQYYILKLAVSQRVVETRLLHQMSLQLFSRLHQGDEHLGHDLLSNVIFNKDFIIHDDLDLLDIEHLNLSEVKRLGSASQEDINLSEKQLLQDATSNLASIRGTYLRSFGGSFRQLMKSRNRALHISHEVDSLTSAPVGQALVPTDWMFYPIIVLYQRTVKYQPGSHPDQLTPSDIGVISDMLKWVLLLECLRPTVMDVVTITMRITRLLCCFIAGSDLFMELPISCYLCALLRKYSTPTRLARMNFEEHIPGLASFYDMFSYVLQQFEAVSFGDSLFSCFILLPLQQRHPLTYRKSVWSEFPAILRTLFLPIKELLLPMANFMEPAETNLEMLRLYSQALLSRATRHSWSPVMYVIAVHHLSLFLFTNDTKHKDFQKMVFQQVLRCKNEELKKHLLYYRKYSDDCDLGFTMYDKLSAFRQKMIEKHSTEISS